MLTETAVWTFGGDAAGVMRIGDTIVGFQPGLQVVRLSIVDDDAALRQQLERIVGRSLPNAHGPSEGGASPVVLWRAPRRWLVTTWNGSESLCSRIAGCDWAFRVHAVDWSCQLIAIAMSGDEALAVLARGTMHDLGETAFPVGSSRQIVLAGTPVHLFRKSRQDWTLLVQRSLAHHIEAWVCRISCVMNAAPNRTPRLDNVM